MKKHVVISGYYGFNNAGDEAILTAIINTLRKLAAKHDKAIEFTVLSADPAQTRARYQVNAVERMHLWQIIKTLKKCDLFLSGGGGLLQDATGRSLSVVYYLGLVLLAKILGKPAVLYAHGIGPIDKWLNKLFVRLICNLADYISVRDEASLLALKNLGVKRPPLELTADPAFLLQPKESAEAPSLPAKEKIIALAVKAAADESYLQEIARAADCLAKEFAAALFLVPMYLQEDLAATKKLAGMLRAKAYLLDKFLLPQELLSLFTHFDLVISVRLHALIFAACAGVPMVGIGYDPKVEIFLEQLGLDTAGGLNDVRSDVLIRQARTRLQDANLQKTLKLKRHELQQKALCTLEKIFFTLFESGDK